MCLHHRLHLKPPQKCSTVHRCHLYTWICSKLPKIPFFDVHSDLLWSRIPTYAVAVGSQLDHYLHGNRTLRYPILASTFASKPLFLFWNHLLFKKNSNHFNRKHVLLPGWAKRQCFAWCRAESSIMTVTRSSFWIFIVNPQAKSCLRKIEVHLDQRKGTKRMQTSITIILIATASYTQNPLFPG